MLKLTSACPKCSAFIYIILISNLFYIFIILPMQMLMLRCAFLQIKMQFYIDEANRINELSIRILSKIPNCV